jgi:uncharacterized protein (TIGR03083 family)
MGRPRRPTERRNTHDLSPRTYRRRPRRLDEYESFAALIDSLDAAAWDAPTRCTGFLVRDVAGHVVGLAEDVVKGRARQPQRRTGSGIGARRLGPRRSRHGCAPRSMAIQPLLDALDDDAWNGPSGVPDLSFGRGVLTLWYDAFVHADDIRAALGRPVGGAAPVSPRVSSTSRASSPTGVGPGDAARSTVCRATTSAPAGARSAGDPMQFVLVATGRADARRWASTPGVNIY